MNNTTYLKLKKPDPSDFYNIADHNDNADLIDAELKRIDDLRGSANGIATLDGNKKLVQKPTPADIGAVPDSRTINKKPLSSNITLTAEDVAALSDVDGQEIKTDLETLTQQSLSVKTNLTTEDLDTVQTTGIYIQNYTSNATTDRHYPVKASGCLMCVSAESKAYQYYVCQNEGCIWMRRYNSKSWSDWEQIYPSVTSGSNDRGTWIKYPDGTMICSIRRTDTVVETGGIVVFFPEPFIDNRYTISANVMRPYEYVACADANYTVSTNVWIYDLKGGSTVGESVEYSLIAIGRWK